MAHVCQEVALRLAGGFCRVTSFLHGLLGEFLIGNVVRQTKQPGYRSVVFADRHLDDRDPRLRSVGPVDEFFFTDNRFAGFHDLLLVPFDTVGVDAVKEILGFFTDGDGWRLQPKSIGHCSVDSQVMAVAILEEDVVRNVLHQTCQ